MCVCVCGLWTVGWYATCELMTNDSDVVAVSDDKSKQQQIN